FFQDAFHEYLVHGNRAAVNPERAGTKAGVVYELAIAPGAAASMRLRLIKAGRVSSVSPASGVSTSSRSARSERKAGSVSCLADFDAIFSARLREADEFSATLHHDIADADARNI